ncbi:MAG: pyridoxamine 5'-phosphate oxidase family protein [Anaerovoracaceae bacterium]
MFREMRRKDKCLLGKEESEKMLEKGSFGILSVEGDDGYPYGVPVSYSYNNGKIFFHSATSGHKLDGIARNPKVCFTVVEQDLVIPKEFTTMFRSVIAFGTANILEDKEECYSAMKGIGEKYSPGFDQEALDYVNRAWDEFLVIRIDVEHITAKVGD